MRLIARVAVPTSGQRGKTMIGRSSLGTLASSIFGIKATVARVHDGGMGEAPVSNFLISSKRYPC